MSYFYELQVRARVSGGKWVLKDVVKAKDLLHLTYAFMLKRKYNIKYFLTRDTEDFGRVKETAKQLLHIEIILVKQNE